MARKGDITLEAPLNDVVSSTPSDVNFETDSEVVVVLSSDPSSSGPPTPVT